MQGACRAPLVGGGTPPRGTGAPPVGGGWGDVAQVRTPIPAPAPAAAKVPGLTGLREAIVPLKPGTLSASKINRPFIDQKKVGDRSVPADDYQEEMVALTVLAALVYMPPGQTFLDIVHSLKTCGQELDPPRQLRMKIVGFTGDRGNNKTSIPVIPPPSNMWKWKSMEVSLDERKFSTCFATEGNNEKLWKPTSNTAQKDLPMALRLLLAQRRLVCGEASNML